jgi:CubicO group peptidase (beta-lactamase class C family)
MTTAGFGPPGTPDVLDQPRGHTAEGKPVEPGVNADNPPAIAPAGLCHMAIRDWAKYVSMHLLGARGESTFLSRASFDRLHEPPKGFAYAMGWAVTERPWGAGTVLNHNGSNTMWFCVTWIAPRRDFAVLICCNQGGDAAAKACDDVAAALVSR